MSEELTIRPLTPETWDAFAALVERHSLSSRTPCSAAILRSSSSPTRPATAAGARGERFKSFTYDELTARDKVNLDITWLRDDSLEDLDNLPAPEVIALEIVEDLTVALAEFEAVAAALESAGLSTDSS